ncbi:MAG: hypothetical protein ABL977_00605 [Candidatus Eisenbacteria bacterium]
MGPTRFERLNAIAGLFAIALFVALGVAWWADRAQHWEAPAWDAARFVLLVAPAADMPPARGELWVVAVNLGCPHCQQHLHALAARIAARAQPPRLAALLVDSPHRPGTTQLGVPLSGGLWWDRDQRWRQRWGRRVYGETFRFDAGGRLLSSTPAGVVPDSSGSRM